MTSGGGVAAMPGFVESLRLLIDDERYSITDIGMMFGVSRERIRKLAKQHGLGINGEWRGLHQIRLWDDASNRFRPGSRGAFTKARKRLAAAARKKRRESFDTYVDRSGGPDACWPWLGTRTTAGYGQFQLNGQTVYAHRFALERAEGRPLKPGEVSRHRCDNPPCSNPAHLQRGTCRENIRDSLNRGRWMTEKRRRAYDQRRKKA